MVPAGMMQVSQNKTPHPFPIGEKHDGKNNAAHQGQDQVSATAFRAGERDAN
jgi:hypothetical protein